MDGKLCCGAVILAFRHAVEATEVAALCDAYSQVIVLSFKSIRQEL